MDELLVKLQIYEGPLDLLLHLIHKNEVNLDDIPVALITAQYLEYLDLMEALNMEVAADFLVMAATLTQIKSRLLLPREGAAEDEGLAEDLRTSLINPLLARLGQEVNFQEAAQALGRRRLLGRDVFGRGGQPLAEVETEAAALNDGFIEASLFDLMEAFRRVSDQKPREATLKFVAESKTIGQRLSEIQKLLKTRTQGTFAELCALDRDRGEVVLSFLALLELARVGFLRLYQNLRQNQEIMIFLADPEAVAESPADLN
ncbi:segregation and condensation protein A [Deltaproteobacteria bacterium]|nr:segregation and condensation protein A [Deltaproteobacteria bacterium]